MNTKSINKGRFTIQEIQNEPFDSDTKQMNRHESLNNCRKFYISTNEYNCSSCNLEYDKIDVSFYDLYLHRWIKEEIVFRKKLHRNKNDSFKIFKYINSNYNDTHDNDSNLNTNKDILKVNVVVEDLHIKWILKNYNCFDNKTKRKNLVLSAKLKETNFEVINKRCKLKVFPLLNIDHPLSFTIVANR